MIATNVAQSIIGWVGGIALLISFILWRADDAPGHAKRFARRSVAILIPCWVLYAIAGGIGALAG